MKKLLMVFVLVTMALGSTGCFHNKVVMSPDYDPSQEIPDMDRITFHIIDLVPINATVNLENECPGGAGVIEDRTFFRFYGLTISQMRIFCRNTSADVSQALAPEVASLDN